MGRDLKIFKSIRLKNLNAGGVGEDQYDGKFLSNPERSLELQCMTGMVMEGRISPEAPHKVCV